MAAAVAVLCGIAVHRDDGKPRRPPVQLDELFPQYGREERDQDEHAMIGKTGWKGAKQRIKIDDGDGRTSSICPCRSGANSVTGSGGRRKKLDPALHGVVYPGRTQLSCPQYTFACTVQKQELARQLNVSSRQVEAWFQNRRASYRATTKLKQTEVDCKYLKRWCESLTDENQRLKQELVELQRSAAAGSPLFRQLPRAAAMMNFCRPARRWP